MAWNINKVFIFMVSSLLVEEKEGKFPVFCKVENFVFSHGIDGKIIE